MADLTVVIEDEARSRIIALAESRTDVILAPLDETAALTPEQRAAIYTKIRATLIARLRNELEALCIKAAQDAVRGVIEAYKS